MCRMLTAIQEMFVSFFQENGMAHNDKVRVGKRVGRLLFPLRHTHEQIPMYESADPT